MAEILAFVKNDRRPTRSAPVDSSEVVVFPRASVRVHWAVTEAGAAAPGAEGRADA